MITSGNKPVYVLKIIDIPASCSLLGHRRFFPENMCFRKPKYLKQSEIKKEHGAIHPYGYDVSF
jgi:hypothetical protein